MVRKLLERIKKQIESNFPGIPVEIPEEADWLHNTVSEWILKEAPPQIDEYTILWCVEKLCLSGENYQEALQTLGILPHNKKNER